MRNLDDSIAIGVNFHGSHSARTRHCTQHSALTASRALCVLQVNFLDEYARPPHNAMGPHRPTLTWRRPWPAGTAWTRTCSCCSPSSTSTTPPPARAAARAGRVGTGAQLGVPEQEPKRIQSQSQSRSRGPRVSTVAEDQNERAEEGKSMDKHRGSILSRSP